MKSSEKPEKEHPKQEGHTTLPERIRPELNIEKWAIWQPANARTQVSLKERTFEREIQSPDGTKVNGKLTVTPTAKGDLTTEDQRVYYALVKIWEAKGRSNSYTSFSLRHLAKVLGRRRWGTQTIKSLRASLARLAMTGFTWDKTYEDGATKTRLKLQEMFHILDSLKTVYRERDGHMTTEAGYFRFHEAILKNLQVNYTKPVLFDVVLSFKSEIAQIIYTHVDLILADKTTYERRTRVLFEDLGLTGKEYAKLSVRTRRLEPALRELHGKPLTTGIITRAVLQKTKGGEDWKLIISKGRAGAALPAALEVVPFAATRTATPDAEELVRYFHLVFHNTRDCSPVWKALDQATSLIARVGMEKARQIVDFAHREARATKFKVAAFGAILQYESRALKDFEKSKQGRGRQQEPDRESKAKRAEADHEQTIDAAITAYLDSLSAESKSKLDAEALAEAGEEQRTRYHRTIPFCQSLLMAGVRRGHVRKLLGLPAVTDGPPRKAL
jgi:hypothetical protein